MSTSRDYVAAVGRVGLAAIFLLSGFGKLAAAAQTKAYIASAGLPAPELAYGAAVVIEIVGGIALVLGAQVRMVAILLAVFTIVAAFGFHANFGDRNQMIHFMKNIAIIGGLFQVAAFGAGAISLDRVFAGKRGEQPKAA